MVPAFTLKRINTTCPCQLALPEPPSTEVEEALDLPAQVDEVMLLEYFEAQSAECHVAMDGLEELSNEVSSALLQANAELGNASRAFMAGRYKEALAFLYRTSAAVRHTVVVGSPIRDLLEYELQKSESDDE